MATVFQDPIQGHRSKSIMGCLLKASSPRYPSPRPSERTDAAAAKVVRFQRIASPSSTEAIGEEAEIDAVDHPAQHQKISARLAWLPG